MNDYMKIAIDEAYKGIKNNEGGPFGCVITKNGSIIAKAHNQVVKKNDATCHGEMQAIRMASKKLQSFNLSGCELYTTGEPCPMCLSAIMWAKIDKVYYGAALKDNAKIGFRDIEIDNFFGKRKVDKRFLVQIDERECLKLFKDYINMGRKTNY